MKILIMLPLLFLVACNDDSSSDPYLSEITSISKAWTVKDQATSLPKFQAVDLTNPNSVSITQVEKEGLFSDCVYQATYTEYNIFMGTYSFDGITSGDQEICEQLESVSYNAVYNSKLKREVVRIHGKLVE